MAKQKPVNVVKPDDYDLLKAREKLSRQQQKTNLSNETPNNSNPTIINHNIYNISNVKTTSEENKIEESTGAGFSNLELSSTQIGCIKYEVNKDFEVKFQGLNSDIKKKIDKAPFWVAIGISISVVLGICGFIINHNYRLSDKIEAVDNKCDTLNTKYILNNKK